MGVAAANARCCEIEKSASLHSAPVSPPVSPDAAKGSKERYQSNVSSQSSTAGDSGSPKTRTKSSPWTSKETNKESNRRNSTPEVIHAAGWTGLRPTPRQYEPATPLSPDGSRRNSQPWSNINSADDGASSRGRRASEGDVPRSFAKGGEPTSPKVPGSQQWSSTGSSIEPLSPMSPGMKRRSQYRRGGSIGIHAVNAEAQGKSLGIHAMSRRPSAVEDIEQMEEGTERTQPEGPNDTSSPDDAIEPVEPGSPAPVVRVNIGAASPLMRKRSGTREALRSRQVIKEMASRMPEGEEKAGSSSGSKSPGRKQLGKLGRDFSHDLFHVPEQTVIIIDWDDTLFPTTWLAEDKGLALDRPLPSWTSAKPRMDRVMKLTEDFLAKCRMFSKHVVILTLARSPWVEVCIQNFAPNLGPFMVSSGIPIVYARDYDRTGREDGYHRKTFASCEEEIAHWTGVKAAAIEATCAQCYSKYPGQSWKNVISIGDSDFEREGTRDTIKRWCAANAKTAYQLPRTKTVKFLDGPSVDELGDQLKLLTSWLPQLVKRDEALNIDLDLASGDQQPRTMEDLVADGRGSVVAESHANAIIDSRLWKLSPGGDPLVPEDWVLRRMWLSSTGSIWYESLEECRPAQCFPGVLAKSLNVATLKAGSEAVAQLKGNPVFVIRMQLPDSVFRSTKSVRPTFIATETQEMRDEWMKRIAAK